MLESGPSRAGRIIAQFGKAVPDQSRAQLVSIDQDERLSPQWAAGTATSRDAPMSSAPASL